MRRGWLALLARADGRSLARALAALLFLNAFVAGIHGGFAAAPGAYAAIICHAGDDGSGPAPAAGHDSDCCLPGVASAALVLPPVDRNLRAARDVAAGEAPDSQFPAAHRALTRAGPRAPPPLPA